MKSMIQNADIEIVINFYKNQNKKVLSFFGYSDRGYNDEKAMLEKAKEILSCYDPSKTIINIGASSNGIGKIYKLAKELGFLTTGIVSSLVSVSSFSKYCDYVFIINDEQYGGYIKGTQKLSPTSEAMIEISDVIIALGGGNIAKDEYQAAKQKNKSATFYPF